MSDKPAPPLQWLTWSIEMDFPARPERQQELVVARLRFIADHIQSMPAEHFAALLAHLPTSALLGAPFKNTPDPDEGFESGWKALLSIRERED